MFYNYEKHRRAGKIQSDPITMENRESTEISVPSFPLFCVSCAFSGSNSL